MLKLEPDGSSVCSGVSNMVLSFLSLKRGSTADSLLCWSVGFAIQVSDAGRSACPSASLHASILEGRLARPRAHPQSCWAVQHLTPALYLKHTTYL